MAGLEVDRLLRFEAATHLRNTKNIKDTLRFVRENPEGFAQRVVEFDRILGMLNFAIASHPHLDPSSYRDVIALGRRLSLRALPTFGDLAKTDENNVQKTTRETFSKVNQLIVSGEWPFAREITDDPNKLATGLLVEGYGLFLERYFKKRRVARTFVLAFEETMLTSYPIARLASDVVEWVLEERGDFPEGIAEKLTLPEFTQGGVVRETPNFRVVMDYKPGLEGQKDGERFFIEPLTEEGVVMVFTAAKAHNIDNFNVRGLLPCLRADFSKENLPTLMFGVVDVPREGKDSIPSPERMEWCLRFNPQGTYTFYD